VVVFPAGRPGATRLPAAAMVNKLAMGIHTGTDALVNSGHCNVGKPTLVSNAAHHHATSA
jgi:hypothetical protein